LDSGALDGVNHHPKPQKLVLFAGGAFEPDGGAFEPDGGAFEPDGGAFEPDDEAFEPDFGVFHNHPPPWIRLLVRRFDRDRVLCVWLRDGRERRDVATISVISNVLYLYD